MLSFVQGYLLTSYTIVLLRLNVRNRNPITVKSRCEKVNLTKTSVIKGEVIFSQKSLTLFKQSVIAQLFWETSRFYRN